MKEIDKSGWAKTNSGRCKSKKLLVERGDGIDHEYTISDCVYDIGHLLNHMDWSLNKWDDAHAFTGFKR